MLPDVKDALRSIKFKANPRTIAGDSLNGGSKRPAGQSPLVNGHNKRQRTTDTEGSEGDSIGPRLLSVRLPGKGDPKRGNISNANGGPTQLSPQKQKQQQRREKAKQLERARMELPVASGRDGILQALAENETIVILGETGSGKTTRVFSSFLSSVFISGCSSIDMVFIQSEEIPQYIFNSNVPCPQPRICITQPRRVATTTLASRVAEEVGCALGSAVGYTVRFDDKSNERTRLKFVTDGTLLQEILADGMLSRYDVVIVDEAHERTLRTDMVLGFLKQIQRKRSAFQPRSKAQGAVSVLGPLKIIVMSATLDADRFSQFFNE